MSAHAPVSSWVAPSDLPRASKIQIPLPSELRNSDGPAFALRPATDPLRAKGSSYDMRELGDACTSVGHVYFHPDTRSPPIPPFAELEAFIAANPEIPVVVDTDRKTPCEAPHILLATFVIHNDGSIGLDRNGNVLISLYTIAADCYSRAFDPATHVKNGEQKEGVDIFDWGMCNFDSEYRSPQLRETYRRIYRDLRELVV